MDWRYNTIWCDQLPEGQMASLRFGNPPEAYGDAQRAKYLFARSFKSKSGDLQDLPTSATLLYLSLTLANINSFLGIGKLSDLKRLELNHCLKLERDDGLETLADSLEWLSIDQSKKFSPSDRMLELKNLKVLRLNSCGPIPSLSFLQAFPKLVDFRFVDTSVEDGNLEPIINHPTLRSVGFFNKRNFNLKCSYVEQLLLEKGSPEVVLAHKGPYETFRLSALGA